MGKRKVKNYSAEFKQSSVLVAVKKYEYSLIRVKVHKTIISNKRFQSHYAS